MKHSIEVILSDLSVQSISQEIEGMICFVTETELTSFHGLGQLQMDQTIRAWKEQGIFRGQLAEVVSLPTYGLLPYPHVILAGLGVKSEPQALRAAGVYAARKAMQMQLERVGVLLFAANNSEFEPAGQALVEGLLLGSYRIQSYRQEQVSRKQIRSVVWFTDAATHPPLREAVRIAQIYAEGTCYARDLTNLPGNLLIPASLVQEAEALAKHHGFGFEVLDAQALAALHMGGIVGVGQGSANPPFLVTICYAGDPDARDTLALVGKGVTFDSGGISLKPRDGMEEMISDMGGAATVLGVMQVIGQLRPRCSVIAVLPIVENMPSGQAMKPGDVIRIYGGKSVEITNTDAEGRLILADAVGYAKQLGATHIIDVATLTGAVSVALGEWATGAITNNEPVFHSFQQAAQEAGERVWLLPSYPEYRKALQSDVADLKNAAKTRSAGAITGGLFIGAFVEDTPWIHLDIAGTAYLSSAMGTEPRGATGVMVRSLANWICKSFGSK